MTASELRLLATFVAGQSVDVAEAPPGVAAHTNGRVIYVSAGRSVVEWRREMLVQSALLGAGSLNPRLVKALRVRPSVARRYLALEGSRVLAALTDTLPLAAGLSSGLTVSTTSAEESLEMARSRGKVPDPPDWFGVIRPSQLLSSAAPSAGTRPRNTDLSVKFASGDTPDDDEDETPRESKILKLFQIPLGPQGISDFLRKLLGGSGSTRPSAAGAELPVRSVRRARAVGAHARPLPTRIHFAGTTNPAAAVGVGGALYPEWDVHGNRYRPQWCRVVDFPLTMSAEISAADVPHDDVLRQRLSRIGLGPKVLRARPDGDELDVEALIDLVVDLRSGYSPPEHVYSERRKLARNLGVLILVDASGSATDTDPNGLAVHDHQRRAAATLAATLEDLGDRVAVYAFRSDGRHAVQLPAIKPFERRFGALERARLNQLQPSSYTRLGAAIRGAGEILKTQAGTPNRLLLVLSDGFPYDHGYEGRYAEADARKSLEELRSDGVACLCLSIGAATATDELERVFGSAGYACGATLAELSPRMDELFLSSLRELAAPIPLRG
ncbi:VWA domain-containing protein [Mycobacterium intermedium]|uniref:VWA domain-containing protein n=1 Tax=Mycobacterium intermedium TaxID=28445 RepID=A0A1E3SBZ1_MYCIE|nr:VWA domain-containing protein [Mycobacterium intermedium]MCV6966887.1 VWA domain-containing protein [Mycobacterium intermedium]ODQ99668.1 VWA domain-containing protein [Mycobacterium intermedium]OPE49041.1 VWA domain-containing protein [Mycobacterium intermedium]ORB07174.1 VWA domain-containing protein [Mycobacterium intermedium]